MEITITRTTEVLDGRGYPLTITRIFGLQEVYIHGARAWVNKITIHDCRDGCCVCYGRAAQDAGESGKCLPPSVQARLKEGSAQAVLDPGLPDFIGGISL